MNIYAPKKPKALNSVSVTLMLIALAFGYFCWAFIPIYWPIFQLKGIVRGACNDAYREMDDTLVVQKLVTASGRTGLRLTKDNFRMERVPYSPPEIEEAVGHIKDFETRARQMKYLRERGKLCIIEYYYRADYSLPLVGVSLPLTFNDRLEGSLETVTW
ncbi:MAG: DUF615 domain-containing protein [Myxococcales bacterium]|nr:DUF615 domain-containing protein [Myxococcales bacterium]